MMILSKFHARQNGSVTDAASRLWIHQRRNSGQYFSQESQHYVASQAEENTLLSMPIKQPEPTWRNMPNKLQLLILALSRLVDFWQMASLQSYMVQQLRSFDSALPDTTISCQAGILQGSFSAAQIVTSALWGRAADSSAIGRKNVLLIGLMGTGVSCIGVGFSRTFWHATIWRLLGGAVNGTVGAARTMVAEAVDKRWHSRAFLLLPIAFNVANILGPVVGGFLVNPLATHPSMFEGYDETAKQWMETYPYATPNVLCAMLLFVEAGLVVAFLDETLPSQVKVRSLFAQLRAVLFGIFHILKSRGDVVAVAQTDFGHHLSPPLRKRLSTDTINEDRPVLRLPFSRIWTSNVLWTLLSVAIFDFHMGAFSSLWIIFLSTPRRSSPASASKESKFVPRIPIRFSGGLGFQPALVGTSLAILGIVGLCLQILLYPWANRKFGLLRCFRYALVLFPFAYAVAPFLSLLPSTSLAPLPASGPLVWSSIAIVVTLQVAARTFALPASIILVNNASPHPSVLGTIHGVGQSVSSAFRTIGPVASGYWYGIGVEKGVIGLSWWVVAAVSTLGCITSFWVRNGTSYEIVPPREEDAERTMQ